MKNNHNSHSRRDFIRTALATTAVTPLLGISARAQDGVVNPFGLKEGSKVEAVIFNGGFGTDYVDFAANIVKQKFGGVEYTIQPSTQIAQELQPRFISQTPPDLIDNAGANIMALSAVGSQLADLSDVIAAPNYEGETIADTLYEGVLTPGTFDGRLVAINYIMTVFAVWYSASQLRENGWEKPTTWEGMKELGAKAKEKGLYLFGWGKEAATYYLIMAIESAIKEGGHEVRLGLENLKPDSWSHPAVQSVFTALKELIDLGYVKPGGAGTQFTAAQAQWTQDQAFLFYPSGAWIENEMKNVTKEGFEMEGMPTPTVSENSALPYTALDAVATEAFMVPSSAQNVAGGKETIRAMLSREAASNFVKTRLAPTIVKNTIPEDGFGSTALLSQNKLLNDAGADLFGINFINLYGLNGDLLVVWNLFLSGEMSVEDLTAQSQKISDRVAQNDSIIKTVVE